MEEHEFLALYDTYYNVVYRLALSITGSREDAEDVVQTVFVRLLSSPPEPGRERPWLMKVGVNAARDILRAPWRRKTEPLEESIAAPEPEDTALWYAVMALPPRLREVVHLHYYEGYSGAEVAEILKISPSAVSMRLHRARKLLRSSLKEDFDE